MEKKEDFLKSLIATFKMEAEEHLRALSSGLIALEKASNDRQRMDVLETVFREAHSLKGAARSVSASEIEFICQSLESAFAEFKKKHAALSAPWLDLLHQVTDETAQAVARFEAGKTPDGNSRIGELAAKLEKKLNHKEVPSKQAPPPKDTDEAILPAAPVAKTSFTDTVRISTAKLDALLLQAEEILSIKLTSARRAKELKETSGLFETRKKQWAKIRPILKLLKLAGQNGQGTPSQKNPKILIERLTEFLDQDAALAQTLETRLNLLTKSAERDQRSFGAMLEQVLEDMKKALMLPFHWLLEIFPKLVRDLSRQQGKEVDLEIKGADIEIDRRILEEIKDPLVHLVRNSIDHGIEKPQDRVRKHKPAGAVIGIAVSQKEGGKIEIAVSDDGEGIDLEKVRASVVKLGLVPAQEAAALGESDIFSFIFHSGVSTSPIVTNISGRGLGLAIVREKVEKLGGNIFVESHRGQGTTFKIHLPLTLATFKGILVRVRDRFFVIPMVSVERVVFAKKDEIKTVENRETMPLEGNVLSLVRLSRILGMEDRPQNDLEKNLPVVILAAAGKHIGFLVDEVLEEREVLVKNLGSQLERVKNIAGATVLESGKTVPIVNVPDLIGSAVEWETAGGSSAGPPRTVERKRKSILVAEDSITARALLKNILETAGYSVKTAVDGVDAFTQLRTDVFDLVVSDVDMPRMSGLDLTAKIRSDKKLSAIPVVLVTALESREDRERGVDVGASAYIVKSSFDQSNLLDVIKRLL
jgi:two-component system chemotaxis sensor kinase CheA